MRWMTASFAAAVLAACTPPPPPSPPPVPPPGGERPPERIAPPQSEFQPSHHAVVEGVVTSRGGRGLDSVTVVAWRLGGDRGSALQTRAATDGAGRFGLPVLATVGPEPDPLAAHVVIRGFGYASRYPRGPGGSVPMDSATVAVTLVPLAGKPAVAQARITLPLP